MKRHVRSTSQKWPIVIFGIFCATTFFACSRNAKDTELEPDGSTQLTFEVIGITDEISEGEISPDDSTTPSGGSDFVQNATRKPSNSLKQPFVATTKMVTTDDFDALITFEEEGHSFATMGDSTPSGSKLEQINSPGKKGVAGAKVAAAMPAGNRYRILIYDNNNAYVGTIDATSGTAFTPGFPVFRNTTYTWYAYSYNSTTSPAVPTNTANPTLTPAAGITALLYDSGTLTTVAGSNKIDITFEHKLASIAIRLDARGMFATINSVTASNSTAGSLSSGVLNLRTGAYNSVTPNTSTTALGNWINAATATGDTIKVAYFYTAATTPLTNFGVTLNNFVINLDDGTTRTFTAKPFTFSTSFTPQLGRRYTGTITLIESAVNVAGILWARSNLYHRPSDQGYRFRHRTSNRYGATANPVGSNEYFNWGARTSDINAATQVLNQCRQVFPYNTWRLPLQTEAQNLVAATTPVKTYGSSGDALYVAWNLGTSSEYGINWLSLLAQGRRGIGTNVLADYSLLVTSAGFFWTNQGGGTTTAPTAFYIRGNVVALGGTVSGGSVVLEEGPRNQGMNIRCVRNVNPTT
ncbi:hypothetical protein PQ465_18810 [Sphingobacterium oryzagri]|uniref:DUF1566 domain-containing protein n=1 Tax=Sphingobacterium oryzagri TaxID=3025669 RepID=A0ABY7WFT0_9SPHI|nr:hypothetical protein [Sphingobacterium sp. KACC 22765]WDF68330.1 hypothetical protein PQ465_18810 [Sphingobacterium sp. KACC 22765]